MSWSGCSTTNESLNDTRQNWSLSRRQSSRLHKAALATAYRLHSASPPNGTRIAADVSSTTTTLRRRRWYAQSSRSRWLRSETDTKRSNSVCPLPVAMYSRNDWLSGSGSSSSSL